ncbi:MAG: UDP-N-acetylglucosamine diphosphorylase, partial [Candidatus Aenigmarchaeota archaeon]|nr:UDP-N-acetylglucosamine diphosphorylase [Candidatus Aenigmarchaeota archaeon]
RDGMAKLGAIIGDGSQIGCNTVTNPGTMIGKNVMVYPNATLKGFVKSDSIVRIRTKTETISRSSGRTR